MSEPTHWIGFSLPLRPVNGTYHTWKYNTLPPLSPSNPFKKIVNLDALEKMNPNVLKAGWFSPTACYFNLDKKSGLFYRDQQDCVMWFHNAATGKVYTDRGTIVSKSLPEFLYRNILENHIWTKCKALGDMRESLASVDDFIAYCDDHKLDAEEYEYLSTIMQQLKL